MVNYPHEQFERDIKIQLGEGKHRRHDISGQRRYAMMMEDAERTYELTAKTDLWTGNADREPNRLITTGLLGSIRWWFEVLVRGLNGHACDPTRTQCEGRSHCVVCELFGCTGWARKFRFEVLDKDGNVQADQIQN